MTLISSPPTIGLEVSRLPETMTSFDDAAGVFMTRSHNARRLLSAWRTDPHHAGVVPFVEGHATRALYRLTNSEVRAACEETEHALGEVRRAVAEAVTLIRDWHPSFAFVHMFHYAMERQGGLPTYQQFRQMSVADPFLRNALLVPSQAIVEEAVGIGVREQDARDAVRWRVGNAYYSFVREVYTIVMLRTHGVDVRYHVLADALLAVDCWVEDVAVSLFIGNSRFRDAGVGRKVSPQQVLQDADPPLRFIDIRLPITHVFGAPHLPPKEKVKEVAERLLRMT